MFRILNYLNTSKKSYFLKKGLIYMGENQMKKYLKLYLLLIILFIPVFLSKAQTSTYGQKSIKSLYFLLPDTQDDANTGGDAGDNFDNATIIGIGSFTGSLPENDTNGRGIRRRVSCPWTPGYDGCFLQSSVWYIGWHPQGNSGYNDGHVPSPR